MLDPLVEAVQLYRRPIDLVVTEVLILVVAVAADRTIMLITTVVMVDPALSLSRTQLDRWSQLAERLQLLRVTQFTHSPLVGRLLSTALQQLMLSS